MLTANICLAQLIGCDCIWYDWEHINYDYNQGDQTKCLTPVSGEESDQQLAPWYHYIITCVPSQADNCLILPPSNHYLQQFSDILSCLFKHNPVILATLRTWTRKSNIIRSKTYTDICINLGCFDKLFSLHPLLDSLFLKAHIKVVDDLGGV